MPVPNFVKIFSSGRPCQTGGACCLPPVFLLQSGYAGTRRRFALYCEAEGLIPHRIRNSFCGGERRPSGEEGLSMYVSYADLFQFALVLIELALFVPALSENKKK